MAPKSTLRNADTPPKVETRKMRTKTGYADARQQQRWWTNEEVHHSIIQLARWTEQKQAQRRTDMREFDRLFGSGDQPTALDKRGKRRFTYNMVRSNIQTVCARIGKAKPRPMFLTSGGDWHQQRKGRKLTQYVSGVFTHAGEQRLNAYDHHTRAFRDACINGTGVVRWFIDEAAARIVCERVLPREIYVDEREARYGSPRTIIQRRVMSRDVLAAMFPDHEEAINNANPPRPNGGSSIDAEADYNSVEAWEAWHLPSKEDGDDGKHAIVIEGTTLLNEPYAKMRFPFVFIHWEPPTEGFWGTGLCHELRGIQSELSDSLRDVQIGIRRMCRPKVLVERNSDVDKAQINNDLGAIVDFTGTPPQFITSTAFSSEMYQHLDRLREYGRSVSGVSEMSSQSQKPAGLNSGVALRTMQDVESERFIQQGQRYEQAFMDSAELVVELSHDMVEMGLEPVVKTPAGRFFESIRFGDVALDDDEYLMKVFPVSALPHTPEGKLQFVSELEQKGYLTKEESMQLLEYPDLDRFTELQTAAMDDIMATLDSICETGEYIEPEPFMPLMMAQQMATNTYLRAKSSHELDEDRLEKLRQFIGACIQLQQAPPPPPPNPFAMPPGAPPGAPPGLPPGPPGPPQMAPPPELAIAQGANQFSQAFQG